MSRDTRLNLADAVICVALVALAMITFRGVLDAEFISYDDQGYVVANPNIQQGINSHSLAWAFRSFDASNWHPLTWISHMVDWELYGFGATGHHLTNLLLHGANGVLLFLFLRLATGGRWRSAFVAALFLCHPLHVESVAWVAERKDVLSTFFGLSAMIFYVRYTQGKRRSQFFFSLVCFALSLMAKGMFVTLPFLLLLLDFWPLQRTFAQKNWRRLFLEKLPFVLLSVGCSFLTLLAQRSEVANLYALPFGARFANAAVVYVLYLVKTAWPEKLAVFYPYSGHWPTLVVLGALLLVTIISVIAIAKRRTTPWFGVGWFWYLGTLVPVIGVIQVGFQSMADRYTYFPLVGIFMVVAWSIPDRWLAQKQARVVVGASASVIVLVAASLAFVQVGYWKNSELLFQHALKVTSKNYIAMNNYGTSLAQKGKLDEAVSYFRESIKIQPGNANAHFNLGGALYQQGKLQEAEEAFRGALKYQPTYTPARVWLGIVYSDQKRFSEAKQELQTALQKEPGNVQALINLGAVFESEGQTEQALLHYGKAISVSPQNPQAHFRAGKLLLQLNQTNEAAQELQIAAQLNPQDVASMYQLGLVAVKLNRPEDAARCFNEVLRLDPNNAEAKARLNELKRS